MTQLLQIQEFTQIESQNIMREYFFGEVLKLWDEGQR